MMLVKDYTVTDTTTVHAVLWTGDIGPLEDLPEFGEFARFVRVNVDGSLTLWGGTRYEITVPPHEFYIIRDGWGRFWPEPKSDFERKYKTC